MTVGSASIALASSTVIRHRIDQPQSHTEGGKYIGFITVAFYGGGHYHILLQHWALLARENKRILPAKPNLTGLQGTGSLGPIFVTLGGLDVLNAARFHGRRH